MGIDFMREVMMNAIRGILNQVISPYSPDDMYEAVINDISLWSGGEDYIKSLHDKLPKFVTVKAKAIIDDLYKYDVNGIYGVVQTWLFEDHTEIYSVLYNTEGGIDWLYKQIDEILIGLGIK